MQAAAAAAREAEIARQAGKLLEERMAPLPGPCLVVPGGFERARVRALHEFLGPSGHTPTSSVFPGAAGCSAVVEQT